MKSEKLTSFALVIAAVALLIVGAMSYRDYLKAKYEKEFGVASTPQSQAASEGRVAAVEALPPARNPGVPAPAESGQNGAPAADTPASPPPPVAPDPRISQYQENLEALRMENSLYRQKLEEAQNGSPGGGSLATIPRPPLPPGANPANLSNPATPSSAVSAVPGINGLPAPVPSGNPSAAAPTSPAAVQQEVTALAEKVRKEASIAKVIEYDQEWAFLVLDGGHNRGIEQEMRFAVRRGGEILGWVKITQVEQDRAVAHLMSGNKNSQTARKPARGDDIIAFNLF